MKKEMQKKLSFVVFVMAVFFAGMSLTVFRSYIWMACIAGVLLLAASVFYVLSREEEGQSPTEKTTELLLADRMAELMRGNEKAEKGVYIAVKKQHEAMEAGMAALQDRVTELVKAQENAVKTLVLYNKENAKQMAMSEREELGLLREEIKQLQRGNGESGSASAVVEAIREMSRRLYEELHENGEAMLSELETTVDSLEEIRNDIKHLGESGPVPGVTGPAEEIREDVDAEMPVWADEAEEAEEMPIWAEEAEEAEEMPVWAEEEETDAPMIPEPVEEEIVLPEISAPQAEAVKEADPNQMLTADDIAALFAQAEEATEPESPEEPFVIPEQEETPVAAEEKPEDAFASSGVDLSDPNKQLSADDIAALFAAMGN